MASPLMNYLRRNQVYVLPIMGVVLIVTWVIGPFLLDLLDTSAASPADTRAAGVVARWKKGSITRSQLDRMRWEHDVVVRFLGGVVAQAQEMGAQPQAPGLSRQADGRINGLGISISSDDQSLVQTLLLAEHGRELGVRVDQTAMMHYLTNLGGFILKEPDFYDLAHQALEDHRNLVSVSQLFERLKVELAATQTLFMIKSGLDGSSTGELWELHAQLYRRCKIEAYPIEVSTYLETIKASDAKAEDLQKIYDEGKDRLPHPMLAEPGFGKPLKLAFGYFRADLQPFLDAAKKDIPAEKVLEEYNLGLREGRFRKPVLIENKEATQSGDDSKKPADESTPSGSAVPADPSGDKNIKTDPSKSPGSDQKASPPADKPAAKTKPADAKEGEAPKTKESPDGGNCQDDSQPTQDDPAETKRTGDDAAKTKPADTKPGADDKPTQEKPADDPATEKPATDPAQTKPKEPEVYSLEEVRDEILSRLAEPAAEAARDSAVKAASNEVRDYGLAHDRWVRSKQDPGTPTTAKDPGELRVQSIAAKYKLKPGKTPLVDRFEVEKLELGLQAVNSTAQGRVPFASEAFDQRGVSLYAPREIGSLDPTSKFIYWRTEIEPPADVTFQQARPQVLQAWRMQQALELAKKDAEALAAKAAQAKTIKEVLTADEAKKVLEPGEFTWLTRDNLPIFFTRQPPRLSDVTSIPLAGEEFMKSVFSLAIGQSGVAVNQPHTTVYAVRVVSDAPPVDIRREMFLSALQQGELGDLLFLSNFRESRVLFDIYADMQKQYQLKWVGSPSDGEESFE